MTLTELFPYPGSQDYEHLAQLSRHVGVICHIEHRSSRVVATTLHLDSTKGDESWFVMDGSATFATAHDIDNFVLECRRLQLVFLPPPGFALPAAN